ncbi:aminodeoxychorismate synthase component I [Amphibacillus jilinensis]|uniref:aminodeoxychorismate synthase component I n=1 Tax=Amphibacillus jilinensis TaxID=1216008 RepID=UPI0002D46763|nr:aminodeoxychorismate synthase component I [Amphibacillus jilinensis]
MSTIEDIVLKFDFKSLDGSLDRLYFSKPINVFSTYRIDQVKPLLREIETERKKGRYIAGYLSYEAAPAFEKRYRTKAQTTMPLLWFASFAQPDQVESDKLVASMDQSLTWKQTTSYSDYQTSIEAIKEAIRIGDTYQVNYTTRLTTPFHQDPEAFYYMLKNNQQASYSAYLDIGRFQILSASPELFFAIEQGEITTKPMKGTSKRGLIYADDQVNKHYLTQSEKERAENLMIVDLLRNDLGKIAKQGTVHVPDLLTVETYPTVHQMTSTVKATLKEESQLVDWFSALFPCGSITGAPKIKTMAYIEQLEETAREVYCGTIGYLTPDNKATFNVPIRTVVVDQEHQQARYGVGGGITWDSVTASEYEEMETKASLLTTGYPTFDLLESMLLSNGDLPLLSYHIDRLQQSATYFNFAFDRAVCREQIMALKKQHPKGVYKVRLRLTQAGNIKLESIPVKPIDQPVNSYLAKQSIDVQNRFYYHKTTYRDLYDRLKVDASVNFSTLLWNERDELTEFTIGNLVLQFDQQFVTPPIKSGLLPGVFRGHLLEKGTITEKVLYKNDLHRADGIWLINAVRGWVKVGNVIDSIE